MTSKTWQFGRHPVNWGVALRARERERRQKMGFVCVCVCVLAKKLERRLPENLLSSHISLTPLCIQTVSSFFGRLDTLNGCSLTVQSLQ